MLDNQQLTQLSSLKEILENFINHKKEREISDLYYGGREFNASKMLNPKAMVHYAAAVASEPDHELARTKRNEVMANATYLLRLLKHTLTLNENNDDKTLSAYETLCHEAHRQFDYSVDYCIQYSNELNNFIAEAPNPRPFNQENNISEEIQALWPLYLFSRSDDEFEKDGDYSLYTAIALSQTHNAETANDSTKLNYLFVLLRSHNSTNRTIGVSFDDVHPSYLEKKLDEKQPEYYAFKRNQLGIAPSGSPLHDQAKTRDNMMRMKLSPNRFKEYTIKRFLPHSSLPHEDINFGEKKLDMTDRLSGRVIGKDNLPLADGWYQYCLLADYYYVPEDPTAPKKKICNEIRYYPCSPQESVLPYKKYVSHSEIAGGLNVFAAGAFMIEHGKIVILDNRSGHYSCKEENLHYAKFIFHEKGLPHEHEMKLDIPQGMNPTQGFQRLKKKLSAAAFGYFASEYNADAEVAQVAEGRPVPPRYLMGEHLYNPCLDRRMAFFKQKINPSVEDIAQNAAPEAPRDFDNIF